MGDFATLKSRARLTNAVREFFDRQGFCEIASPVMINAPAPEEFIEAIATINGKFLRPSPEMALKTLMSQGADRIYELGSCFRAGEHGWKHREEFAMLEWYSRGDSYLELIDFTMQMLRCAAHKLHGSGRLTFRGEEFDLDVAPELLSVSEAFDKYCPKSMTDSLRDDDFDELMVTKIEPNLGCARATFLMDYPADRAALARLKSSDPSVAERWELYICGVELANAYSELIDFAEQKRRFEATRKYRQQNGMAEYPEPVEFLAALERGIGECAGCALGFDRLAMVFLDCDDISQIQI